MVFEILSRVTASFGCQVFVPSFSPTKRPKLELVPQLQLLRLPQTRFHLLHRHSMWVTQIADHLQISSSATKASAL